MKLARLVSEIERSSATPVGFAERYPDMVDVVRDVVSEFADSIAERVDSLSERIDQIEASLAARVDGIKIPDASPAIASSSSALSGEIAEVRQMLSALRFPEADLSGLESRIESMRPAEKPTEWEFEVVRDNWGGIDRVIAKAR